MKIKVGVMGSAEEALTPALGEKAKALGQAIASRDVILLTGATTGLIYAIGKAVHAAEGLHIGISPASDEREHVERYQLPVDVCDAIIFTGFGLKGRNVVLVRSVMWCCLFPARLDRLTNSRLLTTKGKLSGV